MSLSVQCPACNKKLTVLPEQVGKRVRCPKCGHVMVVAASTPVAQSSGALPPSAPDRHRLIWPWYVGGGIAAILVVSSVLFFCTSRKVPDVAKAEPVSVPNAVPVPRNLGDRPDVAKAEPVSDPNAEQLIWLQKRMAAPGILYNEAFGRLMAEGTKDKYDATEVHIALSEFANIKTRSEASGHTPKTCIALVGSDATMNLYLIGIHVADDKLAAPLVKEIGKRFGVKPPFFLNVWSERKNLYVDLERSP